MIELDPASGFPIFRPDGRVLREFMRDQTSRVKIIQGPQGSGTSSACCVHIFQQALAQSKQADGRQRFRAHIFRETYAKIEETVLRTWLDWFPPGTAPGQFGNFYETRPYRHEVRVGPLELDVTFMALEDIRDAKSYFDSLETSLLWFNEGQHAQLAVIRHGVSRVSPPRYPSNKDGGCNWGGLIIDTNAPPADHWIPIMRGDVPPPEWMSEADKKALVKPANWQFYLQPPGLLEDFDDKGRLLGYKPNPDAENLKYLHKAGADPLGPQNFYMEKLGAQTKQWIDAYVMNRSSVVTDGQPVYPQFRREVHVSDRKLEPVPGIPVLIGLDFGRQPAALIGQCLRGDWFVHREFIGRDVSATEFAPALKTFLMQNYPWCSLKDFVFTGDPAGNKRGEANDVTPFQVFAQHGMQVNPAPNPQNQLSVRHEAVNAVLMRRSVEGRPSALLVDPGCVTFITGMSGGYFMRRIRVSGERYADEPEKNQYSHVCFVSGTMIATPEREVAVENLMAGDLVNTPLGPRPVRHTMARMAEVSEYEFSSGAKLRCTKDHPFFTQRGFVAIDAVEYSDQIATDSLAWKFLFRFRRPVLTPSGRSIFSSVCGTIAVRTAISAINAVATCIAGFGRPVMGQSQQAMPSIIGIATPPIIIPPTSNACRPLITKGCTWRASSAERPHLEISSERSSPRRVGGETIQSEQPRSPRKGRLASLLTSDLSGSQPFNAIIAGVISKVSGIFREIAGSAPRSVSARPAGYAAMMMKIVRAMLAGILSASVATACGKAVRVLAKRSCGRALVHNVEIADAHSYYAGGLLVSNCEAGENMLLGGGEGKAVTMGSQPSKPINVRGHRKTMRRAAG